MNKVILCGNISTDVELKTTSGGTPVAKFNLAVPRMEKDKTDFIPIVAWNQVADNVDAYCAKGSKILVDGRIQRNEYDSKDGQKRYSTEVVADRIEFLSPKKVEEKKEDNPYKDMSIKTDFEIGHQIQIEDSDYPWN